MTNSEFVVYEIPEANSACQDDSGCWFGQVVRGDCATYCVDTRAVPVASGVAVLGGCVLLPIDVLPDPVCVPVVDGPLEPKPPLERNSNEIVTTINSALAIAIAGCQRLFACPPERPPIGGVPVALDVPAPGAPGSPIA